MTAANERSAAGAVGAVPVRGRGEAPFWPDEALDVPALRAAGLPRLPFREFLVKVHNRCNLACDHCYGDHDADGGERLRSLSMSEQTAQQVCLRIAEHAAEHRLRSVRIVLHGGEPLLAGAAFLGRLVRRLRELLPRHTRADVLVQTNGTLVDDAVLRVCHQYGILLNVSVDGSRASPDRHHDGSHDAVAGTLDRLGREPHRQVWAGLLCTVDVTSDPVTVHEHLMSCSPPAIDLSLPPGDWGQRPPGRSEDESSLPYARWLSTFFDLWYQAPGQSTRLPLFESVIDLLLGGRGGVEAVGGGPSRLVVVETDGKLTRSDLPGTVYPGAPGTGRDVFRDSLDSLLDHPGLVARQLGRGALADECLACPVLRVCGGGSYAHRHRPGSGFRNPSVYSPDLKAFIRHVSTRVGDAGDGQHR